MEWALHHWAAGWRRDGGETERRKEGFGRDVGEKTREGGVETVGGKWREADCRWEEETGKKSGYAWVTADCKVDPSSMKYSGQ